MQWHNENCKVFFLYGRPEAQIEKQKLGKANDR